MSDSSDAHACKVRDWVTYMLPVTVRYGNAAEQLYICAVTTVATIDVLPVFTAQY